MLVLIFAYTGCDGSLDFRGGRGKDDQGKRIVETGELVAVNSNAFVIPRYGRHWGEMKIIGLLDHGAVVSKGDSVAQFDPSDINRYILDRESDLENQLASLEKMYVEQDNRRQESESRIQSELASYDLKKIEVDASRFETERVQQIKKLEFEQATINLEKEKRIFELSKTINENNLRIQEIRVDQIKNDIENTKALIPLLTLRTPISGVFQIEVNRRDANRNIFKVGDNIYAGNNLANVPDLDHMKVITQINETDFLNVFPNQKVAVRLDALPDVVFEGEVSYIGKLCRRKDRNSRQKIFDIEVTILESDRRLRPGMTVSCEFL